MSYNRANAKLLIFYIECDIVNVLHKVVLIKNGMQGGTKNIQFI